MRLARREKSREARQGDATSISGVDLTGAGARARYMKLIIIYFTLYTGNNWRKLRTVNIQPRSMCHLSRAIFRGAGVLASVLHHHVAYVDV